MSSSPIQIGRSLADFERAIGPQASGRRVGSDAASRRRCVMYPVFLKLDRPARGAGRRRAGRGGKIEGLLAAGAQVTVVAPDDPAATRARRRHADSPAVRGSRSGRRLVGGRGGAA